MTISIEMFFVFGLICLMVGSALGVLTLSLCVTSKRADEQSEILWRPSETPRELDRTD